MSTADEVRWPVGPGHTKPLLSLAAESIVATSGVSATVVDVLHSRALEHYGQGLRQYLSIQLGSVERAGAAFGELRAVVAAMGADALTRPPGVRANLYREARRIAHRRLSEEEVQPTGDTLPWRQPRLTNGLSADALRRMRVELPPDDAELLELRHARELGAEEVAFVVDLPLPDVTEQLEAAERRAQGLVQSTLSRETFSHVLLQTFALEPTRLSAPQEEAPAERPPLPEGTVIGKRYAIERRVGVGAFGDVYRASDTEVPGHVVALKLLHQASFSEEARGHALRELHLIASVFHPSVVQFKDHGWHENRLWFVMPWYEGHTLEERIARLPLTRAEARRIFQPLARALGSMHAAGIRHQDIKPDNIFLARIRGFGHDGDDVLPVLLDLGVAAKEAEMVVAGTPDYFAPEVASQFASVESRHPIGFPADVFSLALSLRNALEPDTREDVPAGAVETFIEKRAREIPALPRSRDLAFLEPRFRRWLNPDPALRPTADELADELAVLTRPEERRRRIGAVLRWLVPLAVAVAVAFSFVVYVLNQRAEREASEAQRAKIMASGLKEDLKSSLEHRKALEQDVLTIRDRYAKGQLTRKQLADELARAETGLGWVRSRLAASERQRQDLSDKLDAKGEELTKQKAKLEQVQSDLDIARSNLEASTDQLGQARTALTQSEQRTATLQSLLAEARRDVELARSRTSDFEARVNKLQGELAAQEDNNQRLAAAVQEADAARRRAEAKLARLQKQPQRPSPEPATDAGVPGSKVH